MARNDDRNGGIDLDTLYVGATRPTTILGVTFTGVVLNMMVIILVFVFTKNLLWLLLFVPVHGICYLICMKDPRTFDLLGLWGKSNEFPVFGNRRYWGMTTYSPLEIQVGKKPSRSSKRRFKELSK